MHHSCAYFLSHSYPSAQPHRCNQSNNYNALFSFSFILFNFAAQGPEMVLLVNVLPHWRIPPRLQHALPSLEGDSVWLPWEALSSLLYLLYHRESPSCCQNCCLLFFDYKRPDYNDYAIGFSGFVGIGRMVEMTTSEWPSPATWGSTAPKGEGWCNENGVRGWCQQHREVEGDGIREKRLKNFIMYHKW